MDPLRVDIMGLTFKVQSARIVHRIERELGMAIEITGLRDSALKARVNLDRIKMAYAKFNEMAPAHATDVEGLTDQIGGMQSDLEFAANVLGNSPPSGEREPIEPPKQPAVENQTITAVDVGVLPPQGTAQQQDSITAWTSGTPTAGHPVMKNIHTNNR